MTDFGDISRPKMAEGKIKKEILIKVHMLFMKFENCFQKWNIYNKKTQGKGLKIWTPKQMLQRLPIVLAHVKAGNTSENLLNEIRQIKYSLYRAKEITKKLYKIMISIKVQYKNEYYIYEFWKYA